MRWLDKLKLGFKKTASILSCTSMDTDTLEESLILADMGTETVDSLMALIKQKHPTTQEELRSLLRSELVRKMASVAKPLVLPQAQPTVILMTGVNGAGKTTTIGKLAKKYKAQGKTVACVAGDTFRAGAVEQLKKWARSSLAVQWLGLQASNAGCLDLILGWGTEIPHAM